ncbi:hypothetical protein [Photobacterium piscicola]|uniref:hypothetical protein n=1 Tax=Photobacterium piscicola TaxID=1378299 RepID=UPI00373683FE
MTSIEIQRQKLIIDIASLDLKRKKTSKLTPYMDQVLVLSQYMSYKELSDWLKKDKGINITPPAIHYMIKKWTKSNMKTLSEITDILLTSNDHSTKQKRRFTSTLDPYRSEIIILHDELNKSGAVIKKWLEEKHNIYVTRDTIYKRIKHWRSLDEK